MFVFILYKEHAFSHKIKLYNDVPYFIQLILSEKKFVYYSLLYTLCYKYYLHTYV